MESKMKTCTKCKIEKELIEFSKRHDTKDGRSSRCRECNKKLYDPKRRKKHYQNNKGKEKPKNSQRELINQNKSIILNKIADGNFFVKDLIDLNIDKKIRNKAFEELRDFEQITIDQINQIILTKKKCKKCGEEKFSNEFNTTGLKRTPRKDCRICQSKQNKKRRINRDHKKIVKNTIHKMLYDAHNRCTNPRNVSYFRYGKKGIKYILDEQKFREEYANMISNMIERGQTPSIDRINPDGHYEISNVRILTHEDNSMLANIGQSRKFRKYRQREMITCKDCGKTKHRDNFYNNGKLPDGTSRKYTQCIPCYKKIAKEKGWGGRNPNT